MSLVVNTNILSLGTQRSLAVSGDALQSAMERLSSGKKINSAADDAAGFAIAERMTAQVRGLNMATKNTNEALSLLAVIENASSDVTDMLQRMRELAVQAANDTNSVADLQYLEEEVDSLVQEIDRVATQTQYNGQSVLDGTFSEKSIQVGSDAGQTVSLSVASLQSAYVGYTYEATGSQTSGANNYDSDSNTTVVGSNTLDPGVRAEDFVSFGDPDLDSVYYVVYSMDDGMLVYGDASAIAADETINKVELGLQNVDLVNDAAAALEFIDAGLTQVSSYRSEYGALQNRLEYTVSNLMNVAEYSAAARSQIEDADFASESARLAKAQVLQQSGAAMLSQANASAQLVLSLIK